MKHKKITLHNLRYGWEDVFCGAQKIGSAGYENGSYSICLNLPGIADSIKVERKEDILPKIDYVMTVFMNLFFETK